MPRLIRVLSLDGGGIRGIIPGTVLTVLEEKLQARAGPDARLADFFDLVAGTSTGSILATGLLVADERGRPRHRAEDLVKIYVDRGPELMAKPFFRRLGTAWGLLNAKYSAAGLEGVLHEYFGELRLAELLRPTLITAYDIERRKACFFRQHRALEEERKDFLVRECVRASAAAPTVFHPYRLRSMTGECFAMVDGGLFANNPALCAYAEVRRYHDDRGAKEMAILSLGTGEVKVRYPFEKALTWGMLQWVVPLLDISLGSAQNVVHFELQQIFRSVHAGDQYLRVTTDLFPADVSPSMENCEPENLAGLQRLGEWLARERDEELEAFADLLVESGTGGDPVAFAQTPESATEGIRPLAQASQT